MMKEAHVKGLEEVESERQERSEGGGGGERGGEREAETEREKGEDESVKENLPPPAKMSPSHTCMYNVYTHVTCMSCIYIVYDSMF